MAKTGITNDNALQAAVVADLKNVVDYVVQKVETINLEGQFNIREFLKKNFIWLAITVGLGVAYFSTFISFK